MNEKEKQVLDSVEDKEKIEKTRQVLDSVENTLQKMRDVKPGDRSELDKRYAIIITDMEKIYAYIFQYIGI